MSTLEVGRLMPGTTELKFRDNGSSYEAWSVGHHNNVGGIGVKHEYYNASDKTMKYITFVYVPYNRVGDVVACSTTGTVEARGKLTGPIQPNTKSSIEWEVLWYNPTITKVVLKEVIIQYADDSEETLSGEDIKNIDSTDSVYYKKRGKKEQTRKAYMSIMVLSCLNKAKQDETIKFHTNQGLLLLIAEVLALFIGVIPFVGGIISLVIWAFAIVFSIKGILDINNNKQNEIPLIGKIKLLK